MAESDEAPRESKRPKAYREHRRRIESQHGRWLRDILYEMITQRHLRTADIARELEMDWNSAYHWIERYGLRDLHRSMRHLHPSKAKAKRKSRPNPAQEVPSHVE